MLKPLLFMMVLVVGSCSSDSLRSAGSGGRGGNGGTGGATAAGGAGGVNPCPAGKTLCSVCGSTQCASDCSTVRCAGGTTGTGGLSPSGGATGLAPSGGAGGTSGSGGATGLAPSGGAGGTSGTGGSGGAPPLPDAQIDGRVDGRIDLSAADDSLAPDAAGSSCENPLPLRCGDRLNHSTLVQGRADVWQMYACTERWMSGREAIYVIEPPTACQVSVRLKNPTADLDLFLLKTCTFMSCTPMGGSTTFAAQAGQPKYLVVDGYDGKAGSYTLEVDCTCDQDGGAIDAPPADAPGDAAAVPGCDSAAAAQALSAFGVVSAGGARMLSATLPAVLATDPNWGLKATACQQAGYDITPLAGKTVCLVAQDMTQMCQRLPGTAWVLMSEGVVACVYKTVRQGFDAAPGVYAANDPSCAVPVIAPGATVACDGRTCTNATGPCCPATMLMSRTGLCASGCLVSVACDGPEDCSNGAVCCSIESAAGLAGASCVAPGQCAPPSRVICHQQTDCAASQTCAVPDPMPSFASTPPGAAAPWQVGYQVCAP